MFSRRTKADDENPFKVKWNKFLCAAQPSSRRRQPLRVQQQKWNAQWAEVTFCARARETFTHRINDDMKQQQQQKCNKIATKVILTTNDFRMSVFIIPALTCGGRRRQRHCCCRFFLSSYFYLLFSLCHVKGGRKKPNKAFETSKECFHFVLLFFPSV